MAHFAELDENNNILRVVVIADEDCQNSDGNEDEATGIAFCQSLFEGGTWKQTSYNGNMRANFAGVDGVYDSDNDVFIPPKIYDSWVLNTTTWDWDAPVDYPSTDTIGLLYSWDEEAGNWALEEGRIPGMVLERLRESDWRVLPDYPEDDQQAWLDYRDELRSLTVADVVAAGGFPLDPNGE